MLKDALHVQRCQIQLLCFSSCGMGSGTCSTSIPSLSCAVWGLPPRMRFLLPLDRDLLFEMWDLSSRSAGRAGNGKWERAVSGQGRFSFPAVLALPTVWIYPDQTCQGKSWLYLKSHYGPSAFHHPADALCCSIPPFSSRNCREKPPRLVGREKSLQDSHQHLQFSILMELSPSRG